MLKSFIFVVLLSLSTACYSSLSASAPKSFVKHLSDSSVALVLTMDDGSVKPFCSGTWISDVEILTANHCVDGLASFLNTTTDGLQVHFIDDYEVQGLGKAPYAIHLATVDVLDSDRDLALLKLSGPKIKHDVAKLAGKLPEVGEAIFSVSTPKGLYFSYLEGKVSGIRDAESVGLKGKLIQADLSTWFGSSGSAIMNDDGEVLGVCSRLAGSNQQIFYVDATKPVITKMLKNK